MASGRRPLDTALGVLESTMQQASEGADLPGEVLRTHTMFIPKGDDNADMDPIVRRLRGLRPITLMRTSAKLVESGINLHNVSVAQHFACGQQRGFVAGRQLADNIIVLEGAIVEASRRIYLTSSAQLANPVI